MKIQVLVLIVVCALLSACDEQNAQANVRALNLVSNEAVIRWHDDNDNKKVQLTYNGNSLLYGQSSDRFVLTNQKAQSNTYRFDVKDYVSKPIVDTTHFVFGENESYYLFAYGDSTSNGEQKAQLGAVYLYKDAIGPDNYRFNIIHTYFPLMTDLDVYLNGKLIKENLKYGHDSGFFTVSTDKNELLIVKANYPSTGPNPILRTTLSAQNDKLQLVFIAPKEFDQAYFSAKAFVVTD
ncbi:hypothetical protein [Pseudoalteromonas tunicata]|uniref:hypothetical protein n=1 Tax=Pseudoalteromonas tunicata TaxID=314281 RepID=UPI00273E69D0|nr:hypothetical protein [Pseudoalteromonas tunicata]MDP4983779.1 DUF4397 domain-containing protein [Pseudoalteromonas tunicata]